MCFAPGVSASDIFHVDCEENELISQIKDKIKSAMEPKLKSYMANSLQLYLVTTDANPDDKQYMEELKRLYRDKDSLGMYLDERKSLSHYFNAGLPQGKDYYIIVHIPEGESIYY